MKKLIKNYTTEISIETTIAEIQKMLGENGASGIAFDYNNGIVVSVYFKIKYENRDLPFKLPARPDQVYEALFAKMPGQYNVIFKKNRMEKSGMIAWRITKLWLEAQLTLVNLNQAKMEEVFLPYLVVGENRTLFQSMAERGMLLPEGKV